MIENLTDALRRYKLVAAFVGERRTDYTELARLEWAELSGSLVTLAIGAVVALVASLFFLAFLSFAVVVSAWDTDWRIATTWIVAVVWLAVCGIAGAVAWSVLRRLRPFGRVRDEWTKDVAVVRTAL